MDGRRSAGTTAASPGNFFVSFVADRARFLDNVAKNGPRASSSSSSSSIATFARSARVQPRRNKASASSSAAPGFVLHTARYTTQSARVISACVEAATSSSPVSSSPEELEFTARMR